MHVALKLVKNWCQREGSQLEHVWNKAKRNVGKTCSFFGHVQINYRAINDILMPCDRHFEHTTVIINF